MSGFIPYGGQFLDEDDIDAVVEVLRSDWLTTGPKIEDFEQALAKKTGANFAVAVSSGTAALHLSCLAAGIGRGDKVITSPITFVASANCALYVGATPDFVDIDPETFNMSVDKLESYLSSCSKDELPKAVIPVDFAGQPVDIEAIKKLADIYGFLIIEDACHALGASFIDSEDKNHSVGDSTFSDMTCFSFHPVKPITTGEGGAITTNSAELYEKLRLLRSHGITKDADKLEKDDGPWYYEMQALGYNYRITDIQCALGMSQLSKLDDFIDRRREIAASYNDAFKNLKEVEIPVEMKGNRSGYHLYVLRLLGELSLPETKREIVKKLTEKGIGTQVHYIPVHLQPYYRSNFDFKVGDFLEAEKFYAQALSLPMFPKMTDQEVRKVIEEIRSVISKCLTQNKIL